MNIPLADEMAAYEAVAEFMGCGINHARLHVETFRRWLGKYTGILDIVFSPKDSVKRWHHPGYWTASWRDRTGRCCEQPSKFPEWIETPLKLLMAVQEQQWQSKRRLEYPDGPPRRDTSNDKPMV